MNLTEMITAQRIELQDYDKTVWTDAELTRGIVKSVALMSRLIPKRAIVEVVVPSAVTGETLTIASGTGTLAKKPIKHGSLNIPNKVVGTHYNINHLTGVVTGLADGNYTVSYTPDPYMIDISTFLTDYIRIERVEYPIGEVPPKFISPLQEIFGQYLSFKEELTGGEYLRLVYLTYWTPPTASADGDFPRSLDNAIIIGSTGQSLIFKAELYTQQALEAAGNSLTLLEGLTDVSFPDVPSIASYLGEAATALDAAIARFQASVTALGGMDTPMSDASTALAKVATEIAAGKSYLGTGESLIESINDAENVAEKYAQYAQVQAQLGQGYGQESQATIALAMTHEAKSAREMAIGHGYINEAVQRLSSAARTIELYQTQIARSGQEVNFYASQLNRAQQYQTTSSQLLNISGRYLASGQAKINEMLVMLGIKPEYNVNKSSSEQR